MTSRAGSACRAGSGRCARRRRWLVSPPEAGNGDVALLGELAQVMRDASICGLGQTAPNAIMSAIEKFGVLR